MNAIQSALHSRLSFRRRADELYMRWARSKLYRVAHRSWLVQLGLLAIVFAGIRALMTPMMKMPEHVYMDGFIGGGLFARPLQGAILLVLSGLALVCSSPIRWRRLGRKWVRVSALILLLLMWWGVAGVGFNYYTNQAYLADRVLMLALVLMSFRWPALTLPAVGYLSMFLGQLGLSAGDLETTDKLAFLYASYALVAWVLLRTVLPLRSRTLLWFLLVLMAVSYAAPGWAKLMVSGQFDPLAWAMHDPLHCFMVTGHAHGWLTWIDSGQVAKMAGILRHVSPLMAAFTLVAELSGPFMILSRRLARVWLVLVIGMHVGIFAMTGILFWKWIAVDLLLIWGLSTSRAERRKRARRRMAALVILLAAFPLYVKPKFLGWLDSNVSETYFIEVETMDGRRARVQQKDFGPYDITFEQGAFHYVNEEPLFNDVWGNAYDYDVGRRLNDLTDVGEVRALIRSEGKVRFNEKKAAELDAFLSQFFKHVNEREGAMRWLDWIGPPHHVQVTSGGTPYDFQGNVRRVDIRFYRTFFDGEEIHVLDDRVIRSVAVE